MAEMRVTVDGGFDPSVGAVIYPLPVATSTGGTPSNPTNVQITDGTNTADVVAAPAQSNNASLSVSSGFINAITTLNNVAANSTGTTVDAVAAKSNWTAVAVASESPTAGTLTLELSLDNTTWVSSGSTASVTAAGNFLIVSTGKPARYARVSLTGLTGTIALTVRMMAAD